MPLLNPGTRHSRDWGRLCEDARHVWPLIIRDPHAIGCGVSCDEGRARDTFVPPRDPILARAGRNEELFPTFSSRLDAVTRWLHPLVF